MQYEQPLKQKQWVDQLIQVTQQQDEQLSMHPQEALLAAMDPYLEDFVSELTQAVSKMEDSRQISGRDMDVKELISGINRNKTWQIAELLNQCNQDSLHEILCLVLVYKVKQLQKAPSNIVHASHFIMWIQKMNSHKRFKKSVFLALAAMIPTHIHNCFYSANLKEIVAQYKEFRPFKPFHKLLSSAGLCP